MGNLHRIQWIDGRIRAGQHPNCTAIAAQFEISVRQAARDIEYLRDSLGAPVAYSARHNGYAYTATNFRLPQTALTVDDKDTLRLLSTQYRQAGSQDASRLALLFQKLAGDSDAPSDKQVDVQPPDFEDPVLLTHRQLDLALQLRRKVVLEYVDARHRTSHRTVHPFLLFTKNRIPYLAAHCELRHETRTFALSRIRKVETLRLGYVIPESFRPDVYLPKNPLHQRNAYLAIVRFPAEGLVRSYPHAFRQLEDGLYQFDFYRSDEFLGWLLTHPPGFCLRKPAWLRDRLRLRLTQMLHDHQET